MDDKKKADAKSPKSESAPGAPVEGAPPAEPKGPVLLTPAEWAEKLGLITRANPLVPQVPTFADWRHAAADKLHGWSDHAYHHQGEQARFLVSQEDYEKALAAAAEFPCCPPHAAALPESQRQRFEKFKPRTKRNKKKPEEATR